MDDIQDIEKKALSEIKKTDSKKEINKIEKRYLGKGGIVSEIFKLISESSPEKRADMGKKANELKVLISKKIGEKKGEIKSEAKKTKEQNFDFTLPGVSPDFGHLHPITQSLREIIRIFEGMGFSVVQGPDVETVRYNFDALNFPKDHPAREMQDTLFIEKEDFLMRTHTSPVQVRFMEKREPPFRIIVPGRVYRNETTDASHEINFYQTEGLMVGKKITVANFKAIIMEFIENFFDGDIDIRLRPSFFPFTEPSFEVDMTCTICDGKGCSVCSNTGWIEVLGAGMVHPNVLKNSNVDSDKWQGFAFGMGIDRLAMIKYGIEDTRLFYSGNLDFLNQF